MPAQYYFHQVVLEENKPDRQSYLAVPLDAYREFFSLEITHKIT